jgi:ABC-type spermidine/putrescine transport system permease subunit II
MTEEASAIRGATWGPTMRKVTVPLDAPGILVFAAGKLIGKSMADLFRSFTRAARSVKSSRRGAAASSNRV